MPHLFVTRPRLHDLLAGDQERARHFRWETINAIVYSTAKQANCVIDKLALPKVDTTSPEIIHIVEPEAPSHSSPVKPFNGQVINIVEPEPVAPVQHGESAASSPVAQFNGQVIDIVDPSEMRFSPNLRSAGHRMAVPPLCAADITRNGPCKPGSGRSR